MDATMSEKPLMTLRPISSPLRKGLEEMRAWAEDAVRKGVSATETEALKEHIVGFVSKDLDACSGT